VNAVHFGVNDNCVAIAWNLLPPLAQVVEEVRSEELRIRAHNQEHPTCKYLGAINLACITVQALQVSTRTEEIRACVDDTLKWVRDYVDTMKKYDGSTDWEILEANMHVCPRCDMQAYPALNESSKCHYCWTKGPQKIICSLSLEGMRLLNVVHVWLISLNRCKRVDYEHSGEISPAKDRQGTLIRHNIHVIIYNKPASPTDRSPIAYQRVPCR